MGQAAGEAAMPGRDEDAAAVARAVAGEVEACRAAFRATPGFSFPDAWLDRQVKAIAYAAPTGADGEGYATVGEVRNRAWGKRGFVLLRGETGEVRTIWVADG